MLKITRSAAQEIREHFERRAAIAEEIQSPSLLFKATVFAIRDAWVTAHVEKWVKRYAKVRAAEKRLNFELKTKQTIHKL